jgi:hypothetical protein
MHSRDESHRARELRLYKMGKTLIGRKAGPVKSICIVCQKNEQEWNKKCGACFSKLDKVEFGLDAICRKHAGRGLYEQTE